MKKSCLFSVSLTCQSNFAISSDDHPVSVASGFDPAKTASDPQLTSPHKITNPVAARKLRASRFRLILKDAIYLDASEFGAFGLRRLFGLRLLRFGLPSFGLASPFGPLEPPAD